MALKIKPSKQLSHVEDWTEGLDWVGNHWYDHLVITKLVSLAVIQENHANVPAGWEADLHPGEA